MVPPKAPLQDLVSPRLPQHRVFQGSGWTCAQFSKLSALRMSQNPWVPLHVCRSAAEGHQFKCFSSAAPKKQRFLKSESGRVLALGAQILCIFHVKTAVLSYLER